MKYSEYGGYIEFETFHGDIFHNGAIALNCGRNCLAYLFSAKKISKLYLPYFLCSTVPEVCDKYEVPYEYYHVDSEFNPLFTKNLLEDEYLYIVNFYGQLSNSLLISLHKKYKNIIVDHAQSYFQEPLLGIDTLYTCRKYFGVADGAFLYTDTIMEVELPVDESFSRMNFLLGRYERCANEFYSEYVANNRLFAQEPIKKMSKLTHNLLCGIDYSAVAKRRKDNFSLLDGMLADYNKSKLTIPNGAFMYPLYVENGSEIRKQLQQKKIYIPTLWPHVFNICGSEALEYDMAVNILPVPVDQRYDERNMEYLVEEIRKCLI